jgi:hypothetical protein
LPLLDPALRVVADVTAGQLRRRRALQPTNVHDNVYNNDNAIVYSVDPERSELLIADGIFALCRRKFIRKAP